MAYIVTVSVDKGADYLPQTRHTTHKSVGEVALIVSTVVLCAGFAESEANMTAAEMKGTLAKKYCVRWGWKHSGNSVTVEKVG